MRLIRLLISLLVAVVVLLTAALPVVAQSTSDLDGWYQPNLLLESMLRKQQHNQVQFHAGVYADEATCRASMLQIEVCVSLKFREGGTTWWLVQTSTTTTRVIIIGPYHSEDECKQFVKPVKDATTLCRQLQVNEGGTP